MEYLTLSGFFPDKLPPKGSSVLVWTLLKTDLRWASLLKSFIGGNACMGKWKGEPSKWAQSSIREGKGEKDHWVERRFGPAARP